MKKPICPIRYLGNNQCPQCTGELMLIEKETYVGALDKKGQAIGGQSFLEVAMRCTKCGAEYEADRKGLYYYIKPKTRPIVHDIGDYNPFYKGNSIGY